MLYFFKLDSVVITIEQIEIFWHKHDGQSLCSHLASFSWASMKSNAFATIKLNFSRVGKEVGKH